MIEVPTYSPRASCGLGFLAEAPGADEIAHQIRRAAEGKNGCALVGKSGWRHERVLGAQTPPIDRWACWHSNTFLFQLPDANGKRNQLGPLLVGAGEARARRDEWRATGEPAISAHWRDKVLAVTALPVEGKWLPPEYWPQLDRLYSEMASAVEDGTLRVLVLYGATALWAVTGTTALKRIGGHLFDLPEWRQGGANGAPLRAIATWHPAFTFHKQTAVTPIFEAIEKAWSELNGTLASYDEPEVILVPETVSELRELLAGAARARLLAIDIETPYFKFGARVRCEPPVINDRARPVNPAGELLTINSVQICADGKTAIVIPFAWDGDPNGLWWRTEADQVEAVRLLLEFLASPGAKCFHHGTFDVQLLRDVLRARLNGRPTDTHLLASAVNPEEPKSLTEVAARWMHVRPWKKLVQREAKEAD